MASVRHGDRVLSVGWDGRLAYKEVYFFNHIEPLVVGRFKTINAVDSSDGSPRRLQLSQTHYMPVSRDASGACSALAAASLAGRAPGAPALLSWFASAQHLEWARDHVMMLPPAMSPGMVAWTVRNGTAAPACITSITTDLEMGAYSPFVRARGIVVDGVVASPHVRWGPVYGRPLLPESLAPHVPAVMEAALLSVYWAYKVMGPERAWRLNNHPLFADGPTGTYVVGNMVVWGQLLLAVTASFVAARVLVHRRWGRASSKAGAKQKTQ